MSTITTIDPPVVKKRGRPKKVVVENAGTVAIPQQPAGVKMASTKATTNKEKVVKEKKAPARTPKTVAAKKDAPKPVARTATPTPVAAKTTPVKAAQSTGTQKMVPAATAAVPNLSATTTAKQPTPAAPASSKILDQVRATGTMKIASPPTTTKPSNTPPTSTTTKPSVSPAQQQSTPKPTHRTTTIPLPRAPLRAPSPKQPAAIPSSTHRASLPHSSPYQYGAASAPRPPRQQRIIEPMADARLPAKYKPAARRITAIMVGLPIVLVLGWELFGRWRGQVVQKKWGGEEKPGI
ncbi:hypothetical protein IQ06DRAFT_373289 [Phaeosphaeriaceae sp. SRC1lsM3a]|nr:hypothetical protein IQ06DRAFT_373289 [Stagonospora sp. SRC1lsM3a]